MFVEIIRVTYFAAVRGHFQRSDRFCSTRMEGISFVPEISN